MPAFLPAHDCGYVGISDGWQDVWANGRLVCAYPRAEDGNIALTGEIDLAACGGAFNLLLAFGRDPEEAGLRARAGLLAQPEDVIGRFVAGWRQFQRGCLELRVACQPRLRRLPREHRRASHACS